MEQYRLILTHDPTGNDLVIDLGFGLHLGVIMRNRNAITIRALTSCCNSLATTDAETTVCQQCGKPSKIVFGRRMVMEKFFDAETETVKYADNDVWEVFRDLVKGIVDDSFEALLIHLLLKNFLQNFLDDLSDIWDSVLSASGFVEDSSRMVVSAIGLYENEYSDVMSGIIEKHSGRFLTEYDH